MQLTVRGRKVLFPVTACGTKYRRQSSKWYGQFTDGDGETRRVPLCADKGAAQQKLNELVKRAERQRLGLFDPAEDYARRPLREVVPEYERYLAGKGDCAEHVQKTMCRINAVLKACGFVFAGDLDPGKVTDHLQRLRRAKHGVALPAGVEEFTPAEAAELLGLSLAGVRAAVQRNRLAANGAGRSRRYPRCTVQILADKAAIGISPAAVNHYIRALRGFVRWMKRTKRIPSDPRETLALVNEKVDIRRARRELTADELCKLFEVTVTSKRRFRGLTGRDRYHLDLTAAGTGFRANALANLTPGDFALDGRPATVTLAARFHKNGTPKVQPLPPDAAGQLRVFLADKPAGQPVWHGSWAKDRKAAWMIRGDLEAAGIPYAIAGPDGPLYADFRALCHSYLTLLGRHGVDLRTAQVLAGHSSPVLTARYTHRRLDDLAQAVDKLPAFKMGASAISERNGGGGQVACVVGAELLAPTLAQPHRTGLPPFAFPCTTDQMDNRDSDVTQPLELTRPGALSHRAASGCEGVDDGARTRDLGSHSPAL